MHKSSVGGKMTNAPEGRTIPARKHRTIPSEEEVTGRSVLRWLAGTLRRTMMADPWGWFMPRSGSMRGARNVIVIQPNALLAEVAPAESIIPAPDGSRVSGIIVDKISRLRGGGRDTSLSGQDGTETEQKDQRSSCFHIPAFFAWVVPTPKPHFIEFADSILCYKRFQRVGAPGHRIG